MTRQVYAQRYLAPAYVGPVLAYVQEGVSDILVDLFLRLIAGFGARQPVDPLALE